MVTLHQRRPSYVVECEGAHLALDDALAEAVNVWATDLPPRKTRRRRPQTDRTGGTAQDGGEA